MTTNPGKIKDSGDGLRSLDNGAGDSLTPGFAKASLYAKPQIKL